MKIIHLRYGAWVCSVVMKKKRPNLFRIGLSSRGGGIHSNPAWSLKFHFMILSKNPELNKVSVQYIEEKCFCNPD